jgi:hypothetical protein
MDPADIRNGKLRFCLRPFLSHVALVVEANPSLHRSLRPQPGPITALDKQRIPKDTDAENRVMYQLESNLSISGRRFASRAPVDL